MKDAAIDHGRMSDIKLAADIGGTFTDIVLETGKARFSGKVLTTTEAPELGVLEGIEMVLGAGASRAERRRCRSFTARRLPPMR